MALPGSASAAPPSCDNGGPPRSVQPGEPKEVLRCYGQPGVAIHVTITQQGVHGTASVVDNDTDLVRVLYTAAPDPEGTLDSFSFQATSSGSEVEGTQNTKSVANTDDVPVCQGSVQSYVAEVAKTAGSCSDPDAGDVLDVTITQQGTKGTAVVVDNNTDHPHVEYTAASTTSVVQDTFRFQATDGSDPKSNLVTVNTQNTPPPPPDMPPTCMLFEGTHIVGESIFLGSCGDDRSIVHVTITAQATKGVASITGNDTQVARVHYTSSALGADQFKVRASAGGQQSQEYTVNTFAYPDKEPGGDVGPEVNPEAGLGGLSAGTVRVGKKGSFTIKRKVDCTGAGPNCKVANTLNAKVAASSAKKKNVKLGSSKFTVKAGKKGAIKLKLTKKGLKLLKRNGKIKGKIKTTVKRGKSVTTTTVSVTLKAPKKK